MKRIVFVLLALVCMAGTAHAAYWKVEAKSRVPAVTDFSILFNDADNDDVVTLGDMVSFSGVTITKSTTNSYNDIFRLAAMTVNGLTLSSPAINYWVFMDPSSDSRFEYDWSYSASVAPTPIPGAVWLLGTGVVGLFGLRRKLRA